MRRSQVTNDVVLRRLVREVDLIEARLRLSLVVGTNRLLAAKRCRQRWISSHTSRLPG